MSGLSEKIKRLERYVSRGEAEKALKGYERLQTRFPNDPVINNRVGFLRNTLHRHAPEWQVRTYVISPRAIAEAHIIAGRFVIALEILEGLLEAEPGDHGLARRVAMVRSMRDGKQDAGLEVTASTQIMSPEMLIDAHLAGGDVHAALRLMQKLCQRRPHDNRLQKRMKSLSAAWDAQMDDQVSMPSINASEKKDLSKPPPLPGSHFEFEVAEVETGRPASNKPMHDVSGIYSSANSLRPDDEYDDSDDDNLMTETQVEIPPAIEAKRRHKRDADLPFPEEQSIAIEPNLEQTEAGVHEDFDLNSNGLQDLLKAAREVIQSNQSNDPFEAAVAHHKRTQNFRSGKEASSYKDRPTQDDSSKSSARLRAQNLDAVSLLRKENLAERRALGSAQDLLSANPHLGRDDAPLLKSSRALPKSANHRPDIHEQITDTGTDPRLKLPSPSIMPHTMEAQAVALAKRDSRDKQRLQQNQTSPPDVSQKPTTEPAKDLSLRQRAAQNKLELSDLREDWDAMANDFDEAETAANPALYAAMHSAEKMKADADAFVDNDATIADEVLHKTLDELNPEDFEETAAGKDPRRALLNKRKKPIK